MVGGLLYTILSCIVISIYGCFFGNWQDDKNYIDNNENI